MTDPEPPPLASAFVWLSNPQEAPPMSHPERTAQQAHDAALAAVEAAVAALPEPAQELVAIWRSTLWRAGRCSCDPLGPLRRFVEDLGAAFQKQQAVYAAMAGKAVANPEGAA